MVILSWVLWDVVRAGSGLSGFQRQYAGVAAYFSAATTSYWSMFQLDAPDPCA
jgi:hypothetical protein